MKKHYLRRGDYRRVQSDNLGMYFVGLQKSERLGVALRTKLKCCCEKIKNYMQKQEKRLVYNGYVYNRGYFLLYWGGLNMSPQSKKLVTNDATKATDFCFQAKKMKYCPWCGKYIGIPEDDEEN